MLAPQIEWTNSSMYPGTTMDVIMTVGTVERAHGYSQESRKTPM